MTGSARVRLFMGGLLLTGLAYGRLAIVPLALNSGRARWVWAMASMVVATVTLVVFGTATHPTKTVVVGL